MCKVIYLSRLTRLANQWLYTSNNWLVQRRNQNLLNTQSSAPLVQHSALPVEDAVPTVERIWRLQREKSVHLELCSALLLEHAILTVAEGQKSKLARNALLVPCSASPQGSVVGTVERTAKGERRVQKELCCA